jgi:hypothetical protein
MPRPYKYIELTDGKRVQAFFQTEGTVASVNWNGQYSFKLLTDGKTCKEIAFVDADGNKITVS